MLWNTRYTDAALTSLREQGHPVLEADAARLSPLVDAHLNGHGRYTFTRPRTPPCGHCATPMSPRSRPA